MAVRVGGMEGLAGATGMAVLAGATSVRVGVTADLDGDMDVLDTGVKLECINREKPFQLFGKVFFLSFIFCVTILFRFIEPRLDCKFL